MLIETCLSAIAYPIGLFLSMVVFLYHYPLRRYSWLRFFPFFLLSLLSNGIAHITFANISSMSAAVIRFFLLLITDILLTVGMSNAFNVPFMSLVTACTSGVALQHVGYHVYSLLLAFTGAEMNNLLEIAIVFVTDLLTILIFGRYLKLRTQSVRIDPRLTMLSIVTVLICVGLTRFTHVTWDRNLSVRIVLSLYAITCCTLAMFMQYYLYNHLLAEAEKDVLQHLEMEKQQHFDISRETTEQLHIIYHDLRHMLTDMKQAIPQNELNHIEQALDSFAHTNNTGLEALDVVLDEKMRLGTSHGVTITYMGNGQDFAFMEQFELYSLFGNLLDNAILAAEALPLQEQKFVSITSEKKGDLLYLVVSNYLVNSTLCFEGGLPVSTKMQEKGFHGYGLRSVRLTAQKYHGDLIVSAMNHIFTVTVYMMSSQGDLPEA